MKHDKLGIRFSDDGTAYKGFRWAPLGQWTKAPDWNPEPVCGGGLHFQHVSASGFRGSGTRLDVIEVDGPIVVVGGDKAKCRRARIVAHNDLSLFAGAKFEKSLDLHGCTGLTELPAGLTVGGSLDLSGCTGLTELPAGLKVGGSLDLRGCTGLTNLPAGLTVGESLDLSGCTGLTNLPAGLTVRGSLYLSGCTGLTELPEGLKVGWSLDLSGCTGLTNLPEGLTVGGSLDLSGCTGLTELPEGLKVGWSLDLSGCTGLTELLVLRVTGGLARMAAEEILQCLASIQNQPADSHDGDLPGLCQRKQRPF